MFQMIFLVTGIALATKNNHPVSVYIHKVTKLFKPCKTSLALIDSMTATARQGSESKVHYLIEIKTLQLTNEKNFDFEYFKTT